MSQAPYMPVFTDALLGDTTHLTAEEFGSYCLILFATWRNNGVPFPDEDARLCLIARCSLKKWRRLRAVLVQFFNLDDGTWRQKRLEKEWRKTARLLAAKQGNSAKGGATVQRQKSDRKTAVDSQLLGAEKRPKISTNDLKSLEPDRPTGPHIKKANLKGEAKKEESRSEPSESGAAREGFSVDEKGLGRSAPSAEPAQAPEPEPAATDADPPTRAEVDELFERTVAALRGDVPKGIRDPTAYKAAVKDAKFTNLVKAVNAWVGTGLDGEARWAAWEVLDAAEKAETRAALTPAARKALDQIVAMYRGSSAGMETAA